MGRATLAHNAKTKDRLGSAPVPKCRAIRSVTSGWTHMAARGAMREIYGAEETVGAGEELNDNMHLVADWEKDSRLHGAVDSFEERVGPIKKAFGGRNDRADVASRPKWRRNAKRHKGFGLDSGDRVLLKNSQETALTSGPFALWRYEVTHTMGALLRVRGVETGRVKTACAENCKLRPHALRLSTRRRGKRRGATRPRCSLTQQRAKRMSQFPRAAQARR